jgi:phage FluMu gp28-like protein
MRRGNKSSRWLRNRCALGGRMRRIQERAQAPFVSESRLSLRHKRLPERTRVHEAMLQVRRDFQSHPQHQIARRRNHERQPARWQRPSVVLHRRCEVGVIKFDNGSRIIAFSANPQAMAVYGGDVGLDEFAKHPNARLLWETAQGRVTWGYDLAIWSSHDGEDTLFNEFAQEARATVGGKLEIRNPKFETNSNEENQKFETKTNTIDSNRSVLFASGLENSRIEKLKFVSDFELRASNLKSEINVPWNLYFKVTINDAIKNGLVDVINKSRGTKFTAQQFLADCKARARDEEIFQQAYMCNPLGASSNHIVEWSAIERCRHDYKIERVHLEAAEINEQFGAFNTATAAQREQKIEAFLYKKFPSLDFNPMHSTPTLRLGFDVAASGQGDLAVIYIDEKKNDAQWLRALFTCRTDDWHFLKTALFHFMSTTGSIHGAGDETGLGRQICWEASKKFGARWKSVNFASKKHDMGFNLMNQLSVAQKRFPTSEQDIANDYFALKKIFNGNKWAFGEGKNALNPASHCDIAWAGALASEAPQQGVYLGVSVLNDDGTWSGYMVGDPIPKPTPYPGWY